MKLVFAVIISVRTSDKIVGELLWCQQLQRIFDALARVSASSRCSGLLGYPAQTEANDINWNVDFGMNAA